MDRKPRRFRAGQIHLLPPADHAAGRADGVHPRSGVRGAQLHPHLAGDAGDPVLLDALTAHPGGVEESDRHVCHAALPQYGKEPVLHSSEDHRELMQTPLCPSGQRNVGLSSGIHELFIKSNTKYLNLSVQAGLSHLIICREKDIFKARLNLLER